MESSQMKTKGFKWTGWVKAVNSPTKYTEYTETKIGSNFSIIIPKSHKIIKAKK